MIRLSTTCFLLFMMLVATGCNRHRVNFNISTAYNAPVMLQDAMIISYPDDDLEEIYRIKLGRWWWAQNYEIPISQAYLSELRGRFGPIFRGGLTVTTNRTIDTIRQLEVASVAEATQERESVVGSELDRLLDEIGAPRPEDSAGESDQRSVQERHQAIFADAAMEALRQNDAHYLLRIEQAAYNFNNSRCQVLLRVSLIDRRTDVTLINNKVYTGRSRTFSPYESERTNNRELVHLTRQALGQAMSPLVNDVLEAVGAR
ncbi:MAG: hypothetical protein JJU11_08400 [Candidatus Sumerlaeia bacterium]|nr:hypothetical protein [Candidatus Sumerlaeia bacterium]